MRYIITGQNGMMGTLFRKKIKQDEVLEYIDGDLIDADVYSRVNWNDEYILVDFAGYKGNDKKQNIRDNLLTKVQLLNNIDLKNCAGIVFISSIAAIGNPQGIIDENTICNPISEYGYAKYQCENILKHYITDVPCVIIRPTNVYASLQEGLMYEISEAFLQKKKFVAWEESLYSKRDYISVDDVIKFILQILNDIENNRIKSQVTINLGSGYAYSLEEIISFYKTVYKKDILMEIKRSDSFAAYDVVINSNCVNKYVDWNFTNLKDEILSMKVEK